MKIKEKQAKVISVYFGTTRGQLVKFGAVCMLAFIGVCAVFYTAFLASELARSWTGG